MSNDQLKTVYVPRFGSQVGGGRGDGPHTKDYLIELPCSQGGKVEKAEKGLKLSTKKVRLAKFDSPALFKTLKEFDETLKRSMPQRGLKRKRTDVNRGKDSQSTKPSQLTLAGSTITGCVSADVFTFSQRNTSEKNRLAVLKTISRMLQENGCIRQRMASLSRSNCG